MSSLHSTAAEIDHTTWMEQYRLRRRSAADRAGMLEVEQDMLFPPAEERVSTGAESLYLITPSHVASKVRVFIEDLSPPEQSLQTGIELAAFGTRDVLVPLKTDFLGLMAALVMQLAPAFPESALTAKGYSLRDPSQISDFLAANPPLLALVSQAHARIRDHFPASELVLQMMPDPEVPGREELLILIRTDLSVDEALDRLDSIDEDWWLDASREASGKLCVDVEFT